MNRYLIVTLFAILASIIALAASPLGIFQLGPTVEKPAEKTGIVFEGYNFNTWGMASISLRNLGDSPVKINGVHFDEQELTLGVVGVPTTHGTYMRTTGEDLKTIETLDMIFPKRNQYNLANYASPSSTMPPSGFMIIYINVDAPPLETEHELKITTDGGTFTMKMMPGETETFKQS